MHTRLPGALVAEAVLRMNIVFPPDLRSWPRMSFHTGLDPIS